MVVTRIILAQDDSSGGSVFFWSAVLIIVVALLFVGIYFVRRWLRVEEDVHGEGFSLGDLRAMQKDGKLTEEEFERAKAKMVEAMHAAQARREAAKAELAKKRNPPLV